MTNTKNEDINTQEITAIQLMIKIELTEEHKVIMLELDKTLMK